MVARGNDRDIVKSRVEFRDEACCSPTTAQDDDAFFVFGRFIFTRPFGKVVENAVKHTCHLFCNKKWIRTKPDKLFHVEMLLHR